VDEAEAYGLKCEYEVKEPEYIVFVDECGANTNQKSDGQVSGSKFLVGKNQAETGSQGSVNDLHFSTLCFQSGNGDPIMVAVILKSDKEDASQLPLTWTAGLDISKDVTLGTSSEDWWNKNSGTGEAMGGGPVCQFRGKTVPCFIGCSPKASITSKLLRDMLAAMDDLEIWERTELPFLDYVTNDETEWYVCIGVPYGSHFWQVADSSQCNGCYKMGITKAKLALFLLKPQDSKGWQQRDIIPIVNKAFELSFARTDKVKNAGAERGWGPLNRVLLLHPDIQSSKRREEEQKEDEETVKSPAAASTSTSTTSTSTNTVTININDGAGSAFMDKLVGTQLKNKGRLAKLAEQKRKEDERTGQHNKLQDMTWISSGTLAA
jgi:hypothetical protein